MIDYDKEFCDIAEDLHIKFDGHFLLVSSPDETTKTSRNLGSNNFIALIMLLRARADIDELIKKLIDEPPKTGICGEKYVKETENSEVT